MPKHCSSTEVAAKKAVLSWMMSRLLGNHWPVALGAPCGRPREMSDCHLTSHCITSFVMPASASERWTNGGRARPVTPAIEATRFGAVCSLRCGEQTLLSDDGAFLLCRRIFRGKDAAQALPTSSRWRRRQPFTAALRTQMQPPELQDDQTTTVA